MDERIVWSIVFVLVVMGLCLFRPNIGRIFLGIFYLIMAIGINCVNAFTNPQSTVQMGAESLIPLYRKFFNEIVSTAPSLFILIVAFFQLSMSMLILNKHKRVKLGLSGATIFLILITPFGIIQLPWLGIAVVQLLLLREDFNETFFEIVTKKFRRNKKE